MANKTARTGYPSLALAVCGFVALGAVIAALGAWSFVGQRLEESRREALAEAVIARAAGVELDFSRELHEDWRNLRLIAEEMTSSGQQTVRTALDVVVSSTDHISWAGLTSRDGVILIGSGGMLEGGDVSARPWFVNGLEGDFAGDVHPAGLFEEQLPADGDAPRRFLDMSTPVRGASGVVEGVLGFHIDHRWVQDYLTETAHAVGLDVYIIDRQGNVVVRTDGTNQPIEGLQSYRSAMTGASQTGIETWSDGRIYFTKVVPAVGYRDLPAFGWSMIARISNDAFPISDFTGVFVVYLMTLGITLAALTALFIIVFVRPFRRLAKSARAVMRGEDVYPYEAKSTSEASVLSAAIARLQSRMHK